MPRTFTNPRYRGQRTVSLTIKPVGTLEALVQAIIADRATRAIDEAGRERLMRVMRLHVPDDPDADIVTLRVDAILLD